MRKTITLNGIDYEVEVTSKQSYILDELNQSEYFVWHYTSTKEMVYNYLKKLVNNGIVPFKSITMKDIDNVINKVNSVVGDNVDWWGK